MTTIHKLGISKFLIAISCLLLSNILMAQTYDKDWTAIDADINNRLPKSAFEKSTKLFDKAMADKNQEQIVKSSIYLMYLEPQLQEVEYDSRLQKEIIRLESSISKSTGGAKALLTSVLADKYIQYAQQNQYKNGDNTTVTNNSSENIALWSIDNLYSHAQALYLKSCESSEAKSISLTTYQNLLHNSNSKYVQTLYDFLHYRAIQALSNERNYITEPTYKFIIQKEQFVDLDQFVQLTLDTKDTSSNKYLTLKLYQKLIKEHLADNSKEILLDIELRRLEFTYNNYVAADNKVIYEKLLEGLFTKFSSTDERFYTKLKLAELKQIHAYQYAESHDSSKQWLIKDAHTIYKYIIQNCKDKNIVSQATNSLKAIDENIVYSVVNEKVIPSQKPSLTQINYLNIDQLYYKIVEKKNCRDNEEDYYRDQVATIRRLLNGKQFHSGTIQLKNLGDFQNHTTEIALPALDKGNYFIIYSLKPDFATSNNSIIANALCVSDLAYFIQKNEQKGEINIYVVDRSNGNPISNAKVELYRNQWTNDHNEFKLFKTETTDNDGKIYYQAQNQESLNFSYIISKSNDKLCENNQEYLYFSDQANQETISEQYDIFLDRAIYRPGQTIYFKGITYQSSNKSAPKIMPSKPVNVIFYDVNWQPIETKSFTTNEYGTFNGTFTAPQGKLLGEMHIQVNGAVNKAVKVEEYKRPSFEIEFDTLKSSPKLGELVKISGKATTYSGAPLNGAIAKYRVVRTMNYPYWRCWWMPIPKNEAEIAQGEVKTDEKGKFNLEFTAIPNQDADRSQFPVFNYEIYVDVVDITGETHNAQKSVRIGQVDFEINADVKSTYSNIDSLKIPINITNLNGDKIDKSFKVTIAKLIDPKLIFQKRYWEIPDQPIMTEAEFKAKFPAMAYKQEDRIEAYKLDKFSKSYSLNSIMNKYVADDLSYWNPGAYKMSISALNADGKEISIERYFNVENYNSASATNPLTVFGLNESYEPGQKLNLNINTFDKNQKYILTTERNNAQLKTEWKSPANSKVQMDILESDRGGMSLSWVTVWNNRIYSGREIINIPWTNKELDIEYMSFRDKLEPGQQEEWQIKIKGKKSANGETRGEKVMAEVLANMYDQSLDVFAANSYSFFPYLGFQSMAHIYSGTFMSFGSTLNLTNLNRSQHLDFSQKNYPSLNIPYLQTYSGGGRMYSRGAKNRGGEPVMEMAMSAAPTMAKANGDSESKAIAGFVPPKIVENGNNGTYAWTNTESTEKTKKTEPTKIKVRSNLSETVFFKPNLMTDKDGNVIIKFKMNEALTKWKFMALATTKELQIGYSEKTIQTRKDLMITPNAPRFMRENDEMEFTAKIANLSDKTQSGLAFIELYDAVTNKNVETAFGLNSTSKQFSIVSGQSAAISWKIKVPEGISALKYRVIAKSENLSDGEENSLPVLTDRMLVTETMPMTIRSGQTKSYLFKEMQEKISSPSLKNLAYKLEFTSNPMWYAIQSLPYLMEYPHDCSEQLFNRYFANALSSSIITQFPKIQSVFESWKNTEAMLSNLSKNQDLKTALLEETPWVFDACSEEEQRRNIALLFDINKIAKEESRIIDQLAERQMSSGGFPWFPGSKESEYITQNIVEGFGHLKVLGVNLHSEKVQQIVEKAIPFLDNNIVRHYKEMEESVKRYKGNINDDHLDAFAIHYLYTRSYFEKNYNAETQKVIKYYHEQAVKYWTKKSMYEEGMIALYLHRVKGEIPASARTTSDMMKSFRERALKNEEKGMYWDNPSGYWWYQLPIETHSLMIEVFDNLSINQTEKDDLRIYLLKNKQTNSWKTTKATAAAIFALLGNQSKSKLDIDKAPTIKLGGRDLNIKLSEAEAGTGYIKKSIPKEEIKAELAKVEITNPNQTIAWGAVYWQYNEKLNNIKINKSSPLRVEKKLYKVLNTERGEQLVEIPVSTGKTGEDGLKIGDRVRVKLMLYVEREMEFLHLKDMRASGLEPREQVSGYKWSGGLGYYQTSRDASMNFFIDYISKGTYTIEYDLNTNIKGIFSNGITTFQSMYAPEFNSHSEGREVKIR